MMEQKAKWYVVHVYSGFENKVSELIREKALKKGLSEKIKEILVPTEKIIEIKDGAKVEVDKNFFPGYIMVKMIFGDDIWHLIKSVPKVSGILGNKDGASVISETEVKRVIDQLKFSANSPRACVSYEIGDQVRVIDGPFISFSGFVEEITEDKQRLKVAVMVFGRETPITLESSQVERMY